MDSQHRPASTTGISSGHADFPLPERAVLANRIAAVSLIALIVLCVVWELWLAPLRPGGSWLVLKALPLLAALFGILHGRRYTHQWTSLLIQLYLLEGLARATADSGMMQLMAAIEVALALTFFIAVTAYARLTAPSRLRQQDSTTAD